jgi:hypothetical protein
MKKCSGCKEEKSLECFANAKLGKDGKSSKCRDCFKYYYEWRKAGDPDYVRNIKYRSRYGISIEDYNKMFSEQDGCCAICGHKPDYNLHVDHCHTTQVVRQLLCHQCNNGLGCFKDNQDILLRAITYLKENELNE